MTAHHAIKPTPLTSAEAARYLGISPRTLEGWRRFNRPRPPHYRYGHRTIRYDLQEILDWKEQHLNPGMAA